jgi:hypothetical protein
MTELMKRYEAETGESAIMLVCTPNNSPRLNITKVTDEYVAWLESQVLNGETIEKFQEIIMNQCDEISTLKAKLTWRPVSEKPEKAGIYFVEAKPYTGCESTIITTAYFDGERFLWHDVVHWLPIPPTQEVI